MTCIELSIEPFEGKAFRHGFHLGTDLELARRMAADMFHARNEFAAKGIARDYRGKHFDTRTVALFVGQEMVDCYDGELWASEMAYTGWLDD